MERYDNLTKFQIQSIRYFRLTSKIIRIIIKRNDLINSEKNEKYMEAIFLSLFFLNDTKANLLILQNEFFTKRIFNFLNAENYNYFFDNEFIDVFDMLFGYFYSRFTEIIQNNCKIHIFVNTLIK